MSEAAASRASVAFVAPPRRPAHPATGRGRGRGFSLVEVIFALLLVGVVYVAAINTLAAARSSQARTHDHALAAMLAQEGMSEVLATPYAEVASVPGTELAGHPGWSRAVDVEAVEPDTPDTTAAAETGARRVRVTVYRGQARLAELVAVRTEAMPSLETHVEALGP